MKKSKKMVFSLVLVFACLISISIIKADSFSFKLTLKDKSSYDTTSRNFVEGNYFVDMSFDSWTSNSCTSGSVQISLYDVSAGKVLGNVTKNIIMYSSYYKKFGYFSGGWKSYGFTRKSCGFVSNKVTVGT